jgi:hypothetical protein
MSQELPLAVLLKLRDELKEELRRGIKKGEIPPEKRAQVLIDLGAIQRRIERLQK